MWAGKAMRRGRGGAPSSAESPRSAPRLAQLLEAGIALFLLCTIPFWTSNIIRMISWIPFLGRNGIANTTLMEAGLIAPMRERHGAAVVDGVMAATGLAAALVDARRISRD